jgi:molybdopterin-guanine dinucleotide biosynthesis protein A
VLAGGSSRRMGRDKAWIDFRGRPLIEHVLAALRPLCADLVVVSSDAGKYERLGARVTNDLWPGGGSLGGLYSGLLTAKSERSILVACDMPFLNGSLLQHLLDVAPDYDAVIPGAPDPSKPAEPTSRGTAKDVNLHPLHAVYSRKCLEPIRRRLDSGDLRMIGFLPDVRVRIVPESEIDEFDPRHLSLLNVNTPGDLELAERLAS